MDVIVVFLVLIVLSLPAQLLADCLHQRVSPRSRLPKVILRLAAFAVLALIAVPVVY